MSKNFTALKIANVFYQFVAFCAQKCKTTTEVLQHYLFIELRKWCHLAKTVIVSALTNAGIDRVGISRYQ